MSATPRPPARMRRLPVACTCACACALAALAGVRTAECDALSGFDPTLLGLARVSTTGGPFAQRVIEREWGPSDDSIYVEKNVPGLKSEAMAGGLSFVLPGAGQAYIGGTSNLRRGAVYALAELTAWTARIMLKNSSNTARSDAAKFAGIPTDSSSAWSLERWARATESDGAELARLYAANPDEFYDVIESPEFVAGWSGDAAANQQHFVDLRAAMDRRLHGSRVSQSLLWVNHVVSAFDALWAARNHNVPLLPAVGMNVRTGYRRGHPEWTAVLTRKF